MGLFDSLIEDVEGAIGAVDGATLAHLKQMAASVKPEEMTALAETFRTQSAQLQGHYETLNGAINNVVGGWRGKAAGAASSKAFTISTTALDTSSHSTGAASRIDSFAATVRTQQQQVAAIQPVDTSMKAAVANSGGPVVAGLFPGLVSHAMAQAASEQAARTQKATTHVNAMNTAGAQQASAMHSAFPTATQQRFDPPPAKLSIEPIGHGGGGGGGTGYAGFSGSGSGSGSSGSGSGTGTGTGAHPTLTTIHGGSPAGSTGGGWVGGGTGGHHPPVVVTDPPPFDGTDPTSVGTGGVGSVPTGTALPPAALPTSSIGGLGLGGVAAAAGGGAALLTAGGLAGGRGAFGRVGSTGSAGAGEPGESFPRGAAGGAAGESEFARGAGGAGRSAGLAGEGFAGEGAAGEGARLGGGPMARGLGGGAADETELRARTLPATSDVAAGERGGMGPMGGAGRPGGSDDNELNKRPDYLVESDDIWGDGRLAAPPVLG